MNTLTVERSASTLNGYKIQKKIASWQTRYHSQSSRYLQDKIQKKIARAKAGACVLAKSWCIWQNSKENSKTQLFIEPSHDVGGHARNKIQKKIAS